MKTPTLWGDGDRIDICSGQAQSRPAAIKTERAGEIPRSSPGVTLPWNCHAGGWLGSGAWQLVARGNPGALSNL